MNLEKYKKIFKEISLGFWKWLKPLLISSRKFIKKHWKKFHLTKISLLLIMTSLLVTFSLLFYQAKNQNIKSLQASLQQTTTIYDHTGEEAGTLYAQKGTFVKLEQIDLEIQDAVLSTEDKRFYTHYGFDPIGIARAAFGFVINKGSIVGGGSTITQQLAKNAYLNLDQTLLRKLKELLIAVEIEKTYEKEEIFEMYLNNAYFGQGVWGVEDASMKYFGKNAEDIELAEAATLAGMLKAPSHYNPIDNRERSKERRAIVLSLMETNNKISEEDKKSAQDTELILSDQFNSQNGYRYPYYFDAVINEAIKEYGFLEEDLLNSGYKVYTSLNPNHQQAMDEVFQEDSLFEQAPDGTLAQSASVSIDPKTGGVTALVGGRGEYTFRGYNRATQMERQPGSVMKPIGVFAPALEAGFDVDDLLVDEKLTYGEDDFTPENLSKTYSPTGKVPFYEAVEKSLNAPTVWLLNEVGIERSAKKARAFGLTISKEDENLSSLALGGMLNGVSPLEMASAYSTFANEGIRKEGHLITKIVDATGAVVVDNTEVKETKVTSAENAETMNSLLLGVFENGTAKNNKPDGFSVAGKTGTTQTDSRVGVNDQWVVGYTPDLVVASWMGYDYTTTDHYLNSTSSKGIGEVLELQLEKMLPYTEQTTFDTEDAASLAESKDSPYMNGNLKETIKRVEEQVKEGTSILKERTRDVFDFIKDKITN
ncbi:PBP1A family penicillin-binding protein [Lacticigenium naphthae]|uniref:PBP1A family penicillin-binding protein n=1 Tax=Lacticigenium naphthae TaxID=515351 RepID=UPI00040EED8A|nr:PBP1A family penicillin-binding protein [Lacticigenium naphthae]